MDETALYRHFDADGNLLYVGIALSPLARLAQHRERAGWFGRIATIKVAWYPSREAAAAAEAEAIRAERPRFNVALTHEPERRPHVQVFQARRLNRLSAVGVEKAGPGKYSDGGGLYLWVSPGGGRKWVFRYSYAGRERYMGLGALSRVPLRAAREKAAQAREALGRGMDPLGQRDAA